MFIDHYGRSALDPNRIGNFFFRSHFNLTAMFVQSTVSVLANSFDPHRTTEKRNYFNRFFTITLVDNLPISTVYWLGRVQQLTFLSDPKLALITLIMIIATAQMLEWE